MHGGHCGLCGQHLNLQAAYGLDAGELRDKGRENARHLKRDASVEQVQMGIGFRLGIAFTVARVSTAAAIAAFIARPQELYTLHNVLGVAGGDERFSRDGRLRIDVQ